MRLVCSGCFCTGVGRGEEGRVNLLPEMCEENCKMVCWICGHCNCCMDLRSFSQGHRSILPSHIAQLVRATLLVLEHQQAKVCDMDYLASHK